MRLLCHIAILLVLIATQAPAQLATNLVEASATNKPPAAPAQSGSPAWSASVSLSTYFLPDSSTYFQPTVTFDHHWLHLEGRYNYEDLDTGSAWVGYNLGGGDKLAWTITPMIGGVFGNTTGVAPGYTGTLSWWKLELYSSGEYVVDTRDTSGSFFYNWSELSLAPVDWFRFGLLTQRTRAYHSDRDVQRGPLLGLSYKQLNFTAYLLNPDDSKPIVILTVGLSF